ncbi:MAG TPA: hypothetical protein VIJ46_05465, partial [Rhabdochlamydiaceae bacterium]
QRSEKLPARPALPKARATSAPKSPRDQLPARPALPKAHATSAPKSFPRDQHSQKPARPALPKASRVTSSTLPTQMLLKASRDQRSHPR